MFETEIMKVDATLAAAWLAKSNTHNRTVRQGKVGAYARDMAAGTWQFNGDTIKFADDGTLLDGQHRLAAVVQSDSEITVIVVRGLPRDTQETMDIGARRVLRDQLQLRGEVNSKELAAIANRMVTLSRGRVRGGNDGGATHAEMFAYIEANPSIRRAAEVAAHAGGRVPVAPSVLGAAYHICSGLPRGGESDAEIFYVTQVIDGVGLYEGDPARALLTRYHKEAQGGRQMSPDDAYRYAIVAWNAFRRHINLSKLQAPKGGWESSPIPTPR